MCLDCGCMEPDERHGDERHLVMKDIVDAAQATGKPVEKTFSNIEETVKKVLDGKLKSKAVPK